MAESFDKTLDLLRDAQDGDRDALHTVVERYRGRIAGLVRRRMSAPLRKKVETDDLLHDVLAEVLRDFDRFEIRDENAFIRWAARIVHTTLVDTVRRRKEGDLDDGAGFVPSEAPSPVTGAMNAEESRRILAALGQLSADHRRVIELREFESLPFARIAELMERSTVEAVQMLHRRALVRLSAVLARSG